MIEEKNKNIKVIVTVIVAILAISLIVYGAIYLKNKISKPVEGSITDEQLIGDANKEIIGSEAQGINLQEEVMALNLEYPDAVAWLMVPGTSIDMPIFKSNNNDRYLRHDRVNVQT